MLSAGSPGNTGFLVNIDEMGVLSHRLNNTQSRNKNYEVILQILNDCLQGNVSGLGFVFAGTDEFLKDQRRGLASYEALERRLIVKSQFKVEGLRDFSGPVIELENLSREDTVVLLYNIRNVFASYDPAKHLITDEGVAGFLTHCSKTLGAEFYLTPGDIVKSYTQLLSLLEQNPGTTWETLIGNSCIEKSQDPDKIPIEDDEKSVETQLPDKKPGDELVSFKL
jgi:hypothetical protein